LKREKAAYKILNTELAKKLKPLLEENKEGLMALGNPSPSYHTNPWIPGEALI
jgi:hypothetical protein